KVEVKKSDDDGSAGAAQKLALKTPAVWILALASAFMYISRYSLNSWGILFLQEAKGFSLETATFIISINALLGILGTVLAGWMSDSLFKGDRKMPAFVSGILLSISYIIFIYGGNEYWVNVASMVLFGIAIGVLIAFLGGLMAVDIVPRKATGAALGVVGIASYVAAGLQDVISGWLIDKNMTIVETVNALGEVVQDKTYDFSSAAIFWIGASIISFLLPVLNWRKKKVEE
ncbi:MAG: MFS transporter, partial [Phascolarctobacterium sp.]|nr:MFS transporter [Phascolarctobacterium sp.]